MLLLMMIFTIFNKINGFRIFPKYHRNIRSYSMTVSKNRQITGYEEFVQQQEKIRENKLKNIVKGIMTNETGVCLFSTISNKTVNIHKNNPDYPVSFLLDYYLDFDGKPFFKINSVGSYASFQENLIKDSPSTSMHIYSLEKNNDNTMENLIIYGKTYPIKKYEDIERLDWIVDNYEDKNSNLYKYFKMVRVDQIELVTSAVQHVQGLEHSFFTFKEPQKCLRRFDVESRSILDYIKMFYSNDIKQKIQRNYNFDCINFITVEEIDDNGIVIIVNYSDLGAGNEKMLKDETVKINFSKKIKNFNELFGELKSIN